MRPRVGGKLWHPIADGLSNVQTCKTVLAEEHCAPGNPAAGVIRLHAMELLVHADYNRSFAMGNRTGQGNMLGTQAVCPLDLTRQHCSCHEVAQLSQTTLSYCPNADHCCNVPQRPELCRCIRSKAPIQQIYSGIKAAAMRADIPDQHGCFSMALATRHSRGVGGGEGNIPQ